MRFKRQLTSQGRGWHEQRFLRCDQLERWEASPSYGEDPLRADHAASPAVLAPSAGRIPVEHIGDAYKSAGSSAPEDRSRQRDRKSSAPAVLGGADATGLGSLPHT